MGKLYEGPLVDDFRSPQQAKSATAISQVWREPQLQLQHQHLQPLALPAVKNDAEENEIQKVEWETVNGLSEQQKKVLGKLTAKGVYWKHPSEALSALFYLSHGGDVEADGNCLFSAAQRSLRIGHECGRDLRRRVVMRFLESYESASCNEKESVDNVIRNLYSPDLQSGWGVHFLQEIKLLAAKADREALDSLIDDLVRVGMERETAAESIYKERCIKVEDGLSWAKYMSVSGSLEDENDIITLQYVQDGLINVDENRTGRAAAFGDDIAIESLATEFKREVFVVQSHDSFGEEESPLFFLPHRPRGEISFYPVFLFMKGTGWCGAGADHYEPLIAYPAPVVSQEKAAFAL